MNPKKQKEKDRRRARKLAEQAWEAADADNLDLAEKIMRRAVAAQEDNPVLWNDLGRVLMARQKNQEADESFRTALSLAPTFADPYNHLAALRIKQGHVAEAVVLQTQAVKHAAQNVAFAERLEAYRALAGEEQARTEQLQLAEPVEPPTQANIDWSARLADLDWHCLGERLTRDGCVQVAGLADVQVCERLCGMFDDDELFAKTVVMDRPDYGLGVYRYFRAPIPDVVEQLRRAIFPYLAQVANRWCVLLGEPERFPEEWQAFRAECNNEGQSTSTPILLKYGPGGFNALHRDLRGPIFFPIQMAVVLSPRADPRDQGAVGFHGGEFLFCDVAEGRKAQRREVPAGQGDMVLFCTRDRLMRVGGVYGLQPVMHAVAPITAGERFVLGVPFHEYR